MCVFDRAVPQQHHVKAAGRWLAQAHQVMPAKQGAAAFGAGDAGGRPAMAGTFALAYLDKHTRAVRCA